MKVITKQQAWFKQAMMLMLSFLLVISSALPVIGGPLVVNAATGDTVYVSKDGNDEVNDGAENSPFATIEKALEALTDEGTIVLLNDITLDETLIIKDEGQTVTIQSKDGVEGSIVRGDGNITNKLIEITSSKVTFKNLKIDGNDVGATNQGIHVLNGSSVVFENVEITKHHNAGGNGIGIIMLSGSTVTIEGTTKIHNNTLSGRREGNPPSLLGAGSGGHIIIKDGLITNNTVTDTSNAVIVGIGESGKPSFTMTGGTIKDNSLNGNGESSTGKTVGNVAVFMRGAAADAAFKFEGTAYVYDNTTSDGVQRNVFLNNTKALNSAYLSLIGAMSAGAKVGVFANMMPTEDEPIVDVAIGLDGYTAVENDAKYFHSDIATSAKVKFNEAGNKVILSPITPELESVWLDQTVVEGKDITFTFSDSITLTDLAGFTIRVGSETVTPATYTVDGNKLVITLENVPTEDIVVNYEASNGDLRAQGTDANDSLSKVKDFDFTYNIAFATDLKIATPDSGETSETKPEIGGTVSTGSTVNVVIKDKNSNVVENAGGNATVTDGNWTFTPGADLAVGEYTVEVTATSDDGKTSVTKTKGIEITNPPIVHPTNPAIKTSEGNTSYKDSTVIVDKDLTLDADVLTNYMDDLNGATVTVDNFKAGDVLAFEDTEKFKATYNDTNGVLTLTTKDGQTATVAEYQAALQSVTFTTTAGNPEDRNITFTLGRALAFSDNDHFYDYIDKETVITWFDAKDEAESKSYFGRQGYLVTITSDNENNFVKDKTQGLGWIGAVDISRLSDPSATPTGDWRWVTGPEGLKDNNNGQPFFAGYGTVGVNTEDAYSNWERPIEPNNYQGNEYVAHIFGPGNKSGLWNDYAPNNASVMGYVIEYGGMPNDATFKISDSKTITFVAPEIESTEFDADTNQVVLTFDQKVSLTDSVGFTIKIGDNIVSLDDVTIIVDLNDETKVIIALPTDMVVPETGLEVSYDTSTGTLKGENGKPVNNFTQTATDDFAASLEITKPTGDPAQVTEPKPEITGKAEAGSTVTVELKDEDGTVIGTPTVTVNPDGTWSFEPDADLADGKYSVEITATKDGKTATKTKHFTVSTKQYVDYTQVTDVTDINPNGVTYDKDTGKFEVPSDVTEFTFKDGDKEITATIDTDGNWMFTTTPTVDKVPLETKYDDVKDLKKSSYTPATWGPFEAAKQKAEDVLNDPNATQAEVDKALQDLEDAHQALKRRPTTPPAPTVDKSLLEDQADEANGLVENDYTPESWNTFKDALTAAKNVLNDPNATQQQVDDARDALRDAQNKLVPVPVAPVVDKSKLQAQTDGANGLTEDQYTPDSWNKFKDALTAAEDVLKDPDATQTEVDDALDALQDAQNKLVPATPAVDKSKLQAQTDGANGLQEDQYTPDSWNTFKNALTAAENVLNDPDATQQKVNDALDALKNAQNNLVPAPIAPTVDKSKLQAQADGANGLSESQYTPDSWNRFKDALTAAENVLKDPNATQQQVDDALGALQQALNNLVPVNVQVVDKSKLQAQVTGANGLLESKYTPDSWHAFQNALTHANNVLKDPNATQQQVDDALQAVQQAKNNLLPTDSTPTVDKSKLQAQANSSTGLTESNYTTGSWNAFQNALTNAKNVLADPNATQQQVDAALASLIAAQNALVPYTGGNGGSGGGSDGSTSTPTPTPTPEGPKKETILVDLVIDGANPIEKTPVTIERTRETNGDVNDRVILTLSNARDAVNKAIEIGNTVARIIIPDVADEVTQVTVDIPAQSIALLQANGIDLEIFTNNVWITIPQTSMDGIEDDFYFRLVPVKDANAREAIKIRAKAQQVVRDVMQNDDITVVARPMTIETNLSSRPVLITLPLRDVTLPTDPTEREAFLKQLAVFIEHTDGERKVVFGEVVTMPDNTLGLRISVSKFSTFTIINVGKKEEVLLSHEAYIKGFEDGTFKPNQDVTRKQVALMIARNLGYVDGETTVQVAPFKDVAVDADGAGAIAYLKQLGIMNGDEHGYFNGGAKMTRAQMAAVVANYKKLDVKEVPLSFTDTKNHWAQYAIEANREAGIITGFEDGTFKPQAHLTRAHAVKMINRMFDRGPLYGLDALHFSDVNEQHWAFEEIAEASTTHDYMLDAQQEWFAK